ncbi:substrate-binding domain-containing protein [Lysinibacillus xylanilyticus]|uniref:substrate-binding domain-containing protein n=1 Tax=Lysinibacillus xylanilyticus TaxID=582475 RepID=UPI003D01AFD5
MALVLKKKDWKEKDLHSEKIKHESMVLITPLKDKQKGNSKTVLYSEQNCTYKSLLDDYLSEYQIEIEGSVDFASLEPIKQCVMNGLGISMLPYFTVKQELDNKFFNGKIIKDDQYAISTFVTYHKDKWVSPAMESMIHLIQSYSKDWD